ncbi:MAG: acetyl-CoA carboxylase carboxyl transferase subunit alpha, partial [Gemmatimonadetes bacterium]|nr:acetyl-CoA carboxylase carboxyl transferase subunit alpha [Gemmatimonadota bacterium]
FGGAHRDMDGAATTLKRHIKEAYAELRGLSPTDLVDQRVEKFASMGHWEE